MAATRLSILNPHPKKQDGPPFLHLLVRNEASCPAIDFLDAHGNREQVTYETLHRESDALAASLHRLHTSVANRSKPHFVVPVMIEQSPLLYITLLGILKAGGAFCPISPGIPSERIEFILEDVAADFLLTSMSGTGGNYMSGKVKVLVVDDLINDTPPKLLDIDIDPNNPAYIMYTSGSTGKPKGVILSHRAATQSILAHDGHMPTFDRFLQFANSTFDVSVFEIFFPLYRGRTLVCCDRRRMLNDLPGVITTLNVDAAELTPSVASSLLNGRASVPTLRLLLTIGEMLKQSVIDDFGGSDTDAGIFTGLYGPTEAAIHCTLQVDFDRGMPIGNIGIPLQTVSAFVLRPNSDASSSDDIDILPLGEEGELAVGGHQLADGYLNRERETKAAFVSHHKHGRLYRTGDRAKIDAAGRLICSGRIASGQVKLRGQRIELGEIEYAASRAPQCRGAIAEVIDGSLVLFYVPGLQDVSEQDILAVCRTWLPPHAVPSQVHMLESLPYMPSGKVDRRALVAHHTRTSADVQLDGPTGEDDEETKTIATVIGEILGADGSGPLTLRAVSLDSLSSIRAASLLRRAGFPPVNATDLLQTRTVVDIRDIMRSRSQNPERSEAMPSPQASSDLQRRLIDTAISPNNHDNVEAVMCCTPLQSSMVAQTLNDPQAYCNWVELRMPSSVAMPEVHRAVSAVIARHPLLRAGFVACDEPCSPYLMVAWKTGPRICKVVQLDREFTTDGLDGLYRPRPIQLCSCEDGIHVLLQLHHALYDQWSIDVLRADLSSALEGEALRPNPSFAQFADHVTFARKSDSADDNAEFWRNHLRSAEPTMLPQLNGVKANTSLERTTWSAASQSTSRLGDVARSLNASPHAFYQAAFAYLLAAYTGSSDVLYGTVFSGRDAPIQDIDSIFGPCLSTLPSRAGLNEVRTCAELVQLLHGRSRGMLRHSSSPLSTIKASSGFSGDAIMFDTLFVWQESTVSDSGSVVEVDSADHHEFSMVLEVKPGVDGLSLRTTFSPTKISKDQVLLFVDQLNHVVEHLMSNPQGLILDIGKQLPARLVSIHNASPTTYLRGEGLVAHLTKAATRQPSKPALVFGKSIQRETTSIDSISYGELHFRADRLASQLITIGTKPNDLVCVCMSKSPHLYVSILAILKTGAGYLPLLPDTPADRFKSILEQANPRICLYDKSSARLAEAVAHETRVLDITTVDFDSAVPSLPEVPYKGADAAYAIFTSGTTGAPKGLVVTQDNLLSHLSVLADIYPLRSDDRLLQACSQAFDVSVFEIFFAWYKGMTLCFAEKDELFVDIEKAIRTLEVTALSLTPTVAALVDPANVPKVRFLVTAGEPMTHLVHARWAGKGLFQGYGPSEIVDICTVNPSMPASHIINNIGRPLPNTSAFVIRLGVPFEVLCGGALGELVFGGEQVFRGYVGRSDLTAESTIDHPQYGRLYRSGDIGRMLPDGSLLISGRLDDQVKIRGNRVELGEIASCLLRHDFVHDCTIWVSGKDTASQELVACWVPFDSDDGETGLIARTEQVRAHTTELFRALASTLPSYMVPDIILPCTVLPRTTQGKLDRRALQGIIARLDADERSLYYHRQDENVGETLQWSATETVLATILERFDPKLNNVGRATSFFALGINSLIAISLARMVNASTGKPISPATILRNASIARLSILLDETTAKSDSDAVSVERPYFTEAIVSRIEDRCKSFGKIATILPCTPLQSAMLAAAFFSSSAAYRNSTTLKLHVSAARLKSLFQSMVHRHEMLRTRFVETDDRDEPFAQVVYEDVELHWTDYSRRSEINGIGTSESSPPVITAERPFCIVAEYTDPEALLTLHMHHAIYDGAALAVLLDEVEALYRNETLLPAPSLRPFIDEVKRHAEPDAMAYWAKQVKDFCPKPLPTLSTTGTNSRVHRTIGLPIGELASFCTRHEISHLSLLQAAWAKVLSRAQGADAICFGDVVSGRSVPVPGTDRLLAPCFNTIPVIAELGSIRTNADLLRQMQEQRGKAEQYQLAPLRRIQAASTQPSCHLFDALLLFQPPSRSLDESIWELRGETGDMDLPLVLEILQETGEWNVVVHYKTRYFNDESARALLNGFLASLRCCVRYPGGDVRTIADLDTSGIDGSLIPQTTSDMSGTSSPSSATDTSDPVKWHKDEILVRKIMATMSKVPEHSIERDTSLYRLGLDSLDAVLVASKLRGVGLKVNATDIMECRTPAAIARAARKTPEPATAESPGIDLDKYDREHRSTLLQLSGLRSADIEAVRPATLVQSALLSQSIQSEGQLYINHVTYAVPACVTSHDLREALRAVQRKHPVLRMGFCETDEARRPFAALIYHADAVELPYADSYTNSTEAGVSENMVQHLYRPLWAAQVDLHHERRRLRLSLHHALYDAESLDLLLAELSLALQGRALGSVVDIDHILGSTLAGETVDGEAFWRKSLQASSFSPFPNLHPCVVHATGLATRQYTSQLSLSELERLCYSQSCTTQAAGQAAWATVLAAYTGEASVTFGTVYSARSAAQHEDVVFPALTTVPVVCDTSDSTTAILEGMVDYNASMQRYRFTPMSEMQRYTNRDALFDTVFVYQKSRRQTTGAALSWTVIRETAAVDYAVSMELQALPRGDIQLSLTTRNDVIPAEHAQLILEQYDFTLAKILNANDILQKRRSERLLSVTPAKEPALPTDIVLLHQWVELGASLHPDKIALHFVQDFRDTAVSHRTWTYAQLDQRANQVAQLIRSHGVKNSSIVALCMEKSPDAAWAFIGILKAGCAFLPIDPDLPAARKKFIIEDSEAQLVLTASDVFSDADSAIPIVNMSEALLDGTSASRVDIAGVGGDALCYCLYTSGTTGQPKGVLITHDSAIQFMLSFHRMFAGRWNSDSRWLQFASYWFDVSVLEYFWSWSVGIAVVGAPRDLILDDLSGFIKRLQITHIDLTPSLARLLEPEDVPSLHNGVFITGGEALRPDIIEKWGRYGAVHNGYGPSESTIGVTMNPRVASNAKPSNIGPQFDNVGTYVLSPGTTQPVLRGAVGELCIGGKLVGKGYLGQPALTANQFPTLGNGDRIYRTGDLVRQLADGSFLFIGRKDLQVKLRGQRLDLGEIDVTLRACSPRNLEAASLVVKSADKQTLVAFVSSTATAGPQDIVVDDSHEAHDTVCAAVAACKSRLPGYMVPSRIIYLHYIPLTVNNKVDAKRLATFFNESAQTSATHSSRDAKDDQSLTTDGRRICSILGRLLSINTDAWDASTNLFSIGLSSISAIAFATSLRKQGFEAASVATIMRNPQIGELARILASSPADCEDDAAVKQAQLSMVACDRRYRVTAARRLGISVDAVEIVAPCTPLQEGLLLESSRDEHRPYFNHFSFNVDHLDLERLRLAVQSVVDQVQVLRTKFIATDHGYVQVVLRKSSLAWHVPEDVRYLDKDVTGYRSTWLSRNNIDFVSPFEVGVSKTPEGPVLTIYMHHALYDGIAMDLLLNELASSYHNPDHLHCAPAFADVLPHGPLRDVPGAEHFWRQQLRGPVSTPLSTTGSPKSGTTNTIAQSFGDRLALADLCRRQQVSHQVIARACFAAALHQFAPKTTLYGSVVSGRSMAINDADKVIGPMFNTLPSRLGIEHDDRWRDAIQRAQEQHVVTLPFQHTSLRAIKKWCGFKSIEPLFDVLFVFNVSDVTLGTQKPDFWQRIEEPPIAEYPLAFDVELNAAGILHVTVVAQSHVADKAALQSILSDFGRAIDLVCTDEQRRVSKDFDITKSADVQTHHRVPVPNGHLDGLHDFTWTTAAEQIRQEIASLAQVDERKVNEHSTMFALGLDSIDAVKLVSRLRKLGMIVPVSEILRAQTVPQMLQYIQSHAKVEGSVKDECKLKSTEESLLADLQLPHQIDRDSIERMLPCTPLQEGVIAEMLRSDFREYFNHDVLRLSPDTDVQRLLAAWQTVCDNSPILRTTFLAVESPEINVAFAQLVQKSGDAHVEQMVLSDISEVSSTLEEIRRDVQATFSFRAPTRLSLVTTGSDRYLVLSLAHAQYDGHSLGLLHADLRNAYMGQLLVMRPHADDIIEASLNAIDGRSLSYWRETLHAAVPRAFPRRSPADIPGEKFHRAQRTASISGQVVRTFCQQQGVSLQSLAQTCWALTLAHYTGCLEVMFGVVLACRDTEEAEEVMFPTMNTVVMRTALHGSRRDVLQQVRDTATEMLPHARTPLRAIQAAHAQSRSDGTARHASPLFDTLFLYQKRPGAASGETVKPLYTSVHSSAEIEYPVAVEIEIVNDEVLFRAACKAVVLDQLGTEQLLEAMDSVLSRIVDQPNEPTVTFSGNRISISGLPEITLLEDHKSIDIEPEENYADILDDRSNIDLLTIREVFAEVSKIPIANITSTTTLDSVGIDSISAIKVAGLLKKQNIRITVSELLRARRIDRIAKVAHEKKSAPSDITASPEATVSRLVKQHLGNELPQFEGIDRGSIESILPASPMQLYMLQIWRRSRGMLFFPTFTYTLRGDVSPNMIQSAWRKLVTEHAILRTVFVSTASAAVPLLQVVLRIFESAVTFDSNAPAPTGQQPMAHLHAIKADGSWELRLSIHHALYDAVSLPGLISDVEALLRDAELPARTVSQEQFLALSVTDEAQRSRQAFWTEYLRDIKQMQIPVPSTTGSDGRTEIFQPALMESTSSLTTLARNNDVSIQSTFFAGCAKAYSLSGQASTGGEDVVLGIYMANRSHLDNLSSLRSPTLNLVPLAVRDVEAKSLVEMAKEIHRDLQEIGSAVDSAVALWEIEKWTGVTVDCFVNFLKLPDAEHGDDDHDAIRVSDVNNGRLEERAEITSKSKSDDFCMPELLQSLPEMSAYKHSVDLEATVRDGALDMGLFCPESLLGLSEGKDMMAGVRRILVDAADK